MPDSPLSSLTTFPRRQSSGRSGAWYKLSDRKNDRSQKKKQKQNYKLQRNNRKHTRSASMVLLLTTVTATATLMLCLSSSWSSLSVFLPVTTALSTTKTIRTRGTIRPTQSRTTTTSTSTTTRMTRLSTALSGSAVALEPPDASSSSSSSSSSLSSTTSTLSSSSSAPASSSTTIATVSGTKPSDFTESEHERAALLNKHLQPLLLSSATLSKSVPSSDSDSSSSSTTTTFVVRSVDVMNAAVRWGAARSASTTKPKPNTKSDDDAEDDGPSPCAAATAAAPVVVDPLCLGSPALRAYHSFVTSDRYRNDPILLDGLARKTAKQIHSMIRQRSRSSNPNSAAAKATTATAVSTTITTTTTATTSHNPPQHFRDKIASSIAKGERRARERSQRTLRTVCPGCSRPFNLCLCNVLSKIRNKDSNHTTSIANGSASANATSTATSTATTNPRDLLTKTNIVVLQHPNEFRKKHTSTVPLLKLVLGTEHVRVRVGYEFNKEDVVFSSSGSINTDNANGDGDGDGDEFHEQHPIMLFPGPEAIDLDEYIRLVDGETSTVGGANRDEAESILGSSSGIASSPQPTTAASATTQTDDANEQRQHPQQRITLVLIDGTWSEAKRIIRKSPEVLKACQMVQFVFGNDDDDDDDDNAVGTTASAVAQPPIIGMGVTKSKSGGTSRSIYNAMRREPDDHCLSTLEACGKALSLLEGPIRGPRIRASLEEVLSEHVALHLRNARLSAQSRHNRDTTSKDEKRKRVRDIETAIYGTSDSDSDSDSEGIQSRSNERTDPLPIQTARKTTIAETPTRLLSLKSDDDRDQDDDRDGVDNPSDESSATVTVRRLTHEDIPAIDAWWENGSGSVSSKAVNVIARSIEADYRHDIGANLGIVDPDHPGGLIGCILRYESGPLGILHVRDDHRGKGYGTALVREATRIMVLGAKKQREDDDDASASPAVNAKGRAKAKANRPQSSPPFTLDCTAFIKDGNVASERVFSRAGWVRENPNAKKRSGRRRANRKWIFPPPPRQQRE